LLTSSCSSRAWPAILVRFERQVDAFLDGRQRQFQPHLARHLGHRHWRQHGVRAAVFDARESEQAVGEMHR
jgi:hypothetical protein